MKGHLLQGDPKLPAVHPVHEGEDEDSASEEGQEDHEAVDFVQAGVIEAELVIEG